MLEVEQYVKLIRIYQNIQKHLNDFYIHKNKKYY